MQVERAGGKGCVHPLVGEDAGKVTAQFGQVDGKEAGRVGQVDESEDAARSGERAELLDRETETGFCGDVADGEQARAFGETCGEGVQLLLGVGQQRDFDQFDTVPVPQVQGGLAGTEERGESEEE